MVGPERSHPKMLSVAIKASLFDLITFPVISWPKWSFPIMMSTSRFPFASCVKGSASFSPLSSYGTVKSFICEESGGQMTGDTSAVIVLSVLSVCSFPITFEGTECGHI